MKYFILSLLFFSSFLWAEEIFELNVHSLPSEILIKDTLDVELDLTFPDDYQVDLEKLRRNVLRNSSFYEHPFSIVDMKVGNPIQKENQLTQHIQMTLQPLRLGPVALTFYDVTFASPNDKKKEHTIISPIFPMTVLSIEAPEQFQGELASLLTFSKTFPLELNEQNRNLVEGPFVSQKQNQINLTQMNEKRLPWIKMVSILLIILIFWIFLKYPHAKPPLTEEQIARLAKDDAINKIEKLREKKLPEKGFFEEFYVELTAPVRAYIERRYKVPASMQTTDEFLAQTAKDPAFPSQTRQSLGQFLTQADKVKFGRFYPTIEECNQAEELAIHFIKADSTPTQKQ